MSSRYDADGSVPGCCSGEEPDGFAVIIRVQCSPTTASPPPHPSTPSSTSPAQPPPARHTSPPYSPPSTYVLPLTGSIATRRVPAGGGLVPDGIGGWTRAGGKRGYLKWESLALMGEGGSVPRTCEDSEHGVHVAAEEVSR